MSRALIVNADDFGRTLGVSQGILRAHLDGIVTSSTVMTNLRDASNAVRLAQAEAPALALGVHLNITFGKPILPPSEVSSLIDPEGCFWGRDAYFAGRISPDMAQIRAEWSAQIERLRDAGVTPDHLDSHHHVAAFSPVLMEIYLDLALQLGCGARPFLPADISAEQLAAIYPPQGATHLRAHSDECAKSAPVKRPDQFFAGFFAEHATIAHLLTLLSNLPQGISELMCHPGLVDGELLATSGYAHERERELHALTSPEVKDAIARSDILLTTYREAWP